MDIATLKENNLKKDVETKHQEKYRMVKFVERKKVERKLKQYTTSRQKIIDEAAAAETVLDSETTNTDIKTDEPLPDDASYQARLEYYDAKIASWNEKLLYIKVNSY